jgi:hypothetical protein
MLITLGRYLDPWEAHVLRARLEAEGIPAYVSNDSHVLANWSLSYALGGAALQVPAEQEAAARAILQDYASGALEADLDAQEGIDVPRCDRCGSDDLRAAVPTSQKALAISLAFWSVTFPTRASTTHCNACGHRWELEA